MPEMRFVGRHKMGGQRHSTVQMPELQGSFLCPQERHHQIEQAVMV